MICESDLVRASLAVTDTEIFVRIAAKVFALNPHCVNQIDDGHLSQYYEIAAGMILFYDALLTLDNEVHLSCI